MTSPARPPQLLAVGGGKGGVGKSVVSVALACASARAGARVALVDLDLGGGNLHSCLGLNGRQRGIAEFLTRRAATLEELLCATSVPGLSLISAADYVSGMAHPPHWMKQKLIRHLRALPVDRVIIDLGAGVHVDTLDFFCAANDGLVVTVPEPTAVMNAYGFIKAVLFRTVLNALRGVDELGPRIEAEFQRTDAEGGATLDWLHTLIGRHDPELLDVVGEIESLATPRLVLNRAADAAGEPLVGNLLTLCRERLGIELDLAASLPECPQLGRWLLRLPALLQAPAGAGLAQATERLWASLAVPREAQQLRVEYSDQDIARMQRLLDQAGEDLFADSRRETWKLRLYFRPREVARFLIAHGVDDPVLYVAP